MLDPAQQQEQYSLAYVRAVVAVAGFAVYSPSVDEDSVDLGIASRLATGAFRAPRLEVQLKCTSQEIRHEAELRFPLRRKNYDDLRSVNLLVPRILLVVLVPTSAEEWLDQDEERLALRRCGYWASLYNAPDTDNETSVTVRMPRTNVFSPPALREMMARVGQGLSP